LFGEKAGNTQPAVALLPRSRYSIRVLRISLLGTFQLERDGSPIHLPTRKVEALLAYLALHPTSHTREKLATLFWGDVPDAQARASLRNALPALRKQLGEEVLIVDRETVQLNPNASVWIDVAEFKAQAATVQRAAIPDPTAVNIALYRGELLAGFNEEWNEWVLPEREALQTLYINTALRLCQQLRAQGNFHHTIQLAENIIAIDSTVETAYQQLMTSSIALGEHDAALKYYDRCVRILHDDLGVEPSHDTKTLYEQIRRTQASRPASLTLTNLPIPITSFIGREREIETIKQLLNPSSQSGARLVTLTGPGGAGKTRLAIQVTGDLAQSAPERICWIELAALTDPALVAATTAKTLGLHELPGQPIIETLVDHLRSRPMLLVLDNCEHLILPSAQLVNALLQACPQLQVLCTSREVLGLTGEIVYPVPSLTINEEAVQLFVERATAAVPAFRLTDQNTSLATRICQQLDGIPLAIELAAARVKVLPVEQIAERLADRFNLLTGGSRAALPRHQTLRAAIDWSYDLLTEDEQVFFRQASVFPGGFSLEAIETIAGSPVLDTLTRLVDKSLILAEGGRYHLLETIRQYAADKLWLAGEEATVKRQLLKWIAGLAEQAGLELQGPKQNEWFDRLETEHDNIRAALSNAVEGAGPAIEQALNICGALWFFWGSRGYLTEARERLAKLLAHPEAAAHTPARARALLAAGGLAIRQSDYLTARPLFTGSLALWREIGDPAGIASALHYCGWAANALGDFTNARLAYEESLAIRRGLGSEHIREVADSLVNLGMLAFCEKDYASAHAFQKEGLNLQRASGELWNLTYSLFQLGITEVALKNYDNANTLLNDGIASAQTLKDQVILPYLLEAFACLAAARGEHQRAARLFGAAEARREIVHTPMPPQWQRYCAGIITEMQSFSETEVASAWAEGRAMSLESAIAYATRQSTILRAS
jgi:predicted ATPase/DNA-binding SARP family transcriptional activator